jgi:hypothetical protein
MCAPVESHPKPIKFKKSLRILQVTYLKTNLKFLLLILTASGYVPGGSGATIHITQYNIQKTQNKTFTLKTIHNTKITNTITQNCKHNAICW